MAQFITADEHYGHDNKKGGIIAYCKRPFPNIETMDSQLIKNHNDVVTDRDEVIHVGDFTLNNHTFAWNIIRRLKGKMHYFIPGGVGGGHDKRWIWNTDYPSDLASRITVLDLMHEFKFDKKYYMLSHYPMLTWARSKYGSTNLHGHSHGMVGHYGSSAEKIDTPTYGIRLDVGVDVYAYFPQRIEKLAVDAAWARANIDQKKKEAFGKTTPLL